MRKYIFSFFPLFIFASSPADACDAAEILAKDSFITSSDSDLFVAWATAEQRLSGSGSSGSGSVSFPIKGVPISFGASGARSFSDSMRKASNYTLSKNERSFLSSQALSGNALEAYRICINSRNVPYFEIKASPEQNQFPFLIRVSGPLPAGAKLKISVQNGSIIPNGGSDEDKSSIYQIGVSGGSNLSGAIVGRSTDKPTMITAGIWLNDEPYLAADPVEIPPYFNLSLNIVQHITEKSVPLKTSGKQVKTAKKCHTISGNLEEFLLPETAGWVDTSTNAGKKSKFLVLGDSTALNVCGTTTLNGVKGKKFVSSGKFQVLGVKIAAAKEVSDEL